MSVDHAAELADLEYHWGSAYVIEFCGATESEGPPEEWMALRRDGEPGNLSALSARGLRALIIADYSARPVPR